jgi:hypothetical protein
VAVQIFIEVIVPMHKREKSEGVVVKEEKLVTPVTEDNIKEESSSATTITENTPLKKVSINKHKKH